MDVGPKPSALVAKTIVLLFVLVMVAIFLMKPPLTSSIAPVQEGRVFENTIPKVVPIGIKIKKEKEQSFKDLKNERWARDFELELTNLGDKPIYYIDILMVTDVKAAAGHRIVFPLQYGRVGLSDIISKPLADDVPIEPGGTHVFRIHPGQVPAWEQGQREENRPQPKKMRFELQLLSFGDGTGYFGNKPYPQAGRRQSAVEDRIQPPNKGGPNSSGGSETMIEMPVTFVPAFFLEWDSLEASLVQDEDQLNGSCGLFDYCIGIVPYAAYVCHNCPNQNRPTLDSGGLCKEPSSTNLIVTLEVRSTSVKQLVSTTAVLGRVPLPCPRRRQRPHRVPIAQTQALLAQRTVPILLTPPVALTRFKDMGAVIR